MVFLFTTFTYFDFYFLAVLILRCGLYIYIRFYVHAWNVFFDIPLKKIYFTEVKFILYGVGSTISQSVVNLVLNQSLITIIVNIFGLEMAGVVGGLRTISRSVLKLSNIISATAIPFLSSKTSLIGVFIEKYIARYVILNVGLSILTYVLTPLFYTLLLGFEYEKSLNFLLLVLIFETLGLSIYQFCIVPLASKNQHFGVSFLYLLCVSSLIFSISVLSESVTHYFIATGLVSLLFSFYLSARGNKNEN